MNKPKTLGDRYKLEERIAAGGMGTVYIATDKRLRRRVAVKLLGEHLAHDDTYIERFRREARAAAALSHTNIAGVFDYGEDGGDHFIVMELVAAQDLSKLLRNEGKLDPGRALGISIQIADALGHAHGTGMVHRDIKPANILVGRGDHVKVTDFGIARTAGDMTLTAAGSVLGTAHYISPEQASGRSLGAPSDVYSAGIVLFEMLTGAVPFTGESIIAVAMRHTSERVPAPSSLVPGVPGELDEILARATHQDPDRRYADGEEFAAALRGVQVTASSGLAGAAVAAAPTATLRAPEEPGFVPLEERWQPQKVGRIVVMGFLALTLILFLLGAFRFVAGPPQPAPGTETTGPTPQTTETRGAGAEKEFILQDSIIGRPAGEVIEELEARDFEVLVEHKESDQAEGRVIDSDPKPGSALNEGQTVTLIVSSGDDDEDDEDDDGPGQGKAKGKDKKEKDD